jgi:DNA-directed RNA polymerase subunit RPC12/RpoP
LTRGAIRARVASQHVWTNEGQFSIGRHVMGTAEQAAIRCEACGKKYAWKAELRGKTVRCKCGQMILIPAPAAEEDLYDLAPEP